jgi:kynurenine formamidase
VSDKSTAPLTFEELMARTDAPAGSTWGLYGDNDEVGMVNVLTPDRVLSGVGTVRRGAVFNLDLPLDAFDPHFSTKRSSPVHNIFPSLAPHHYDDYLDGFYLQGSSQVDGLRHVGHPEHGFYNGHAEDEVQVGSPVLGVNRWAQRGIVGRGVLLDIEGYFQGIGEPLDHQAGQAFDADVLDAVASAQGVEVQRGDMVLLRTGWANLVRNQTVEERLALRTLKNSAGIRQSEAMFRWLWEHQVPLLAADNVAVEALPTVADTPFLTEEERARPEKGRTDGMFHEVAIPLLGMVLGELWDFEALTEDCLDDGVWDFLLVVKPLFVTGGVGSPPNALAIK